MSPARGPSCKVPINTHFPECSDRRPFSTGDLSTLLAKPPFKAVGSVRTRRGVGRDYKFSFSAPEFSSPCRATTRSFLLLFRVDEVKTEMVTSGFR